MTEEIPYYGLRAYALFFARHGTKQEFGQNELDWIVSRSMKKKIFSLLSHTGWIQKTKRGRYKCVSPEKTIIHLLDFRVPRIIQDAKKQYAFTGLSAVEIWSDYSYIQRGIERSPYFIKVLKKDISYWKGFFNTHRIPTYINNGTFIGEFVILIPVKELKYEEKDSFKVDKLKEVKREAEHNSMYAYPYEYIQKKYGA